MKEIKIKDNSKILREELYSVSEIVERVANKTLDQLAKEGVFVFPENVSDAEDITKDQMILQSINGYICTSNVMGFVGSGESRLVIESRFCSGKKDFLTQYLVEKVVNIPNVVELETNSSMGDNIFNILLFLFPKYLKEAVRKGLFKTYIRNEHNDASVKGTIDVARHIKINTPFIGNIAYSQREYINDNYLIELIRHTIEYIRKKSFGNTILEKSKEENKQIIDATPGYKASDRRKVIEVNQKKLINHAYYHEYKDLQKLCLLILQENRSQIGSGKDKIYGVLFDGAWLWEEYLNIIISDKFYHPVNKASSGAQRLFSDGVGLIYPDFIGKDENNRIIADAKYKPFDNIGNKDYLQLLAYMFRFEAKKGYYLYPETGEIDGKQYFLKKGNTFENNVSIREDVFVSKIGLYIPQDAKDYKDFMKKMEVNEQNFVNLLMR